MRLALALPTLLTAMSATAAVAGLTLLRDERATATGLLCLGQVCDVLDGIAARRLGAVTEFGGHLDWSVDAGVAHIGLALSGVAWASPLLAALQAWSLAGRRRISGRSAVVLGAIVAAFAW